MSADRRRRMLRQDVIGGQWVATCPEVPGAAAQGETPSEALTALRNVFADLDVANAVLTRPEQLVPLPERTAVRSREGLLAEKGPDGNWYMPAQHVPIPVETLLIGGARVLDLGGAWTGESGFPSRSTGRADGTAPTAAEMRAMLDEAIAPTP